MKKKLLLKDSVSAVKQTVCVCVCVCVCTYLQQDQRQRSCDLSQCVCCVFVLVMCVHSCRVCVCLPSAGSEAGERWSVPVCVCVCVFILVMCVHSCRVCMCVWCVCVCVYLQWDQKQGSGDGFQPPSNTKKQHQETASLPVWISHQPWLPSH